MIWSIATSSKEKCKYHRTYFSLPISLHPVTYSLKYQQSSTSGLHRYRDYNFRICDHCTSSFFWIFETLNNKPVEKSNFDSKRTISRNLNYQRWTTSEPKVMSHWKLYLVINDQFYCGFLNKTLCSTHNGFSNRRLCSTYNGFLNRTLCSTHNDFCEEYIYQSVR